MNKSTACLNILKSSLQLFILFPSHTSRQFLNTLKNGLKAVWTDKFKK